MVDSAWTKLTRSLLVWSWLIAANLALVAVIGSSLTRLLILRLHEISIKLEGGFA